MRSRQEGRVVGNSDDGNAALRMESKKELTMKNSSTLTITAAVVLAIFMAPTPAGAQARDARGARGAAPANLNGPTPRLPNGKPDFSAQSWARPFTGDITLTFTNPDGTSNKGESNPLPFTQWGQAQWDNYNPPKNGDYAGSCMPFGWIRSFSPHPMSIQQNNNYIMFLFEQSTMFQMVPTDGRPHREGWPPTWFGDSVGHWEGDTLVIEVVNLNGYAKLATIGQPMSDQAKITMYFTRPDYGHINFKWVLDDPKTYTRPLSNERVFVLTPNVELMEYGCMEGNLRSLLEGAITPWIGPPETEETGKNLVYGTERDWPAYDLTKPQKITGVIRQVLSRDPFEFVRIDAAGKMLDVLLAPPVRMEFRGLPERTFQTGVTITVDAVPSKTKPNEVRAQTVTINGKTTEMR